MIKQAEAGLRTYEAVPEELKALPQWVNWGRKGSTGKDMKKPYNPKTKVLAKPGKLETCGTFTEALQNVHSGDFTGAGFMLANGVCGIDFDHCINPETGELKPEVLSWVKRFGSYTEVSQSSTGVHVLCKAKLSGGGIHKSFAEVYDSGRYFALTGIGKGTLHDAQEPVDALYAALQTENQNTAAQRSFQNRPAVQELTDSEVLEKAENAANGAAFQDLFCRGQGKTDDKSSLDLSLCNLLAFYCGSAEQVDRIFRQSALYRTEKWDKPHYTGGETYGHHTAVQAWQGCTEHYAGVQRTTATQDFQSISNRAKPIPFAEELPAGAEPFPADALPDAVRDFVQAEAEALQVPAGMIAPLCLSCLSLAAAKKAVVEVTPAHKEPLNLWTLVLADSGAGKSPALKKVFAPVYRWQEETRQQMEPKIAASAAHLKALEHEKSRIEHQMEAPRKTASEQAHGADLEGDLSAVLQELSAAQQAVVRAPILVVQDATTQALAKALSEQQERLTIADAEGLVFDIISATCKASNGSSAGDVTMFIHAWGGEPVTSMRISRQPLVLREPLLTFGIMTQPEHFKQALSDPQLTARGLFARFLINLPQHLPAAQRCTEREARTAPASIVEAWHTLVANLLNEPVPEEPLTIRYLSDAAEVSNAYERKIKIAADTAEAGGLKEFLAKLPAQMNRITGLLHIAKYVCTGNAAMLGIEADTAQKATQICEYYRRQAEMLYGISQTVQEEQNALYVLHKLQKAGTAGTLQTYTAIRRLCRKLDGKECKEDFDAALEQLTEHRYLRKTADRPPKYLVSADI